ncbi:MAG: hypothetical protein KGP12_00965 [Actinomycetales bacterium]|nr:hypothetical protein [Actinomycetales bacterium]
MATPNFALLTVGRVIEGRGVGIVVSGLLAIIAEAAPPNSRGRACGLGLSSVRWRSWPVVAAVMATVVLLLNGESVWFLDLRVGPAAGFLEQASAIAGG